MSMPVLGIIVRGTLHDDVHMQRVVPIVLALGRPCRSERPSWQSLQPSKVGDVVDRPQPAQRTAGKVRDWESIERTIRIQVARQGEMIRITLTEVPLSCLP